MSRRRLTRVTVLNILERGAGVLRKAGLGRLVDSVARRAAPTVGTFDVEIDGLRLHGDHIGQLYYVRELLESDREATFIALLKSSIRDGMTVVEGGAHMGYVTLQSARAAGPDGRVFTFEPNPRAIPLIQHNLAVNGLDDRVTVVQLALADAPGAHSFYLSGGGDTSSLHVPDGASEHIEVGVTTLDTWLDRSVLVDVVKLDIEGAEVAALRGMSETLGRAGAGAHGVCGVQSPDARTWRGLAGRIDRRAAGAAGSTCEWIDEKQGLRVRSKRPTGRTAISTCTAVARGELDYLGEAGCRRCFVL